MLLEDGSSDGCTGRSSSTLQNAPDWRLDALTRLYCAGSGEGGRTGVLRHRHTFLQFFKPVQDVWFSFLLQIIHIRTVSLSCLVVSVRIAVTGYTSRTRGVQP